MHALYLRLLPHKGRPVPFALLDGKAQEGILKQKEYGLKERTFMNLPREVNTEYCTVLFFSLVGKHWIGIVTKQDNKSDSPIFREQEKKAFKTRSHVKNRVFFTINTLNWPTNFLSVTFCRVSKFILP